MVRERNRGRSFSKWLPILMASPRHDITGFDRWLTRELAEKLSIYVSDEHIPDTRELKQNLRLVSADVGFELLKKQYGRSTTALHVAAWRGHTEVMRCLLEMVEPQKRYELLKIQSRRYGSTPLHLAASRDRTEIMRCMLELVELENQIQLLDIPNKSNMTALDVAKGEETAQLIKQYRKSAKREMAEGKSPRGLLSYVLNDLSLEEQQSLMSDERLRSKTFLVNWPHDGNLSGVKMAQAGFYCVDDYDRVQCTFCHGSVHNWEVEDNPMTEHIKLFPSCSFVKGFELGTKEYKNENNTDKRDVTTETSGELLEDSGDLKDAEEQNGMQSNEKESSLPATSVNELVDGERLDVLLEPADEIKGITEDMDISSQDIVVESKHSAVVDNVQPDSVLVQKLRLKIAELEAELAGYQSDAGRGSHELRDTVEGQIVSLTGVEVSSTTSDRTHNEDIAGTHKSLVNEDEDEPDHNSPFRSVEHGDEPGHNSSSRSVEDEAYRIFSSTADEKSLHLIHLMNIWKDINVTVKEITQNIDIVNPENIDHSLPDSTLFKADVEPALSEVEVKVMESPEDNEMRDQIPMLTQKLTAKLKNANQGVQMAAIRDICDGLICVSPSNAAAATQQDVNGTQQSDLSVTIDAVEEVGAEMDNMSDEDQIHP